MLCWLDLTRLCGDESLLLLDSWEELDLSTCCATCHPPPEETGGLWVMFCGREFNEGELILELFANALLLYRLGLAVRLSSLCWLAGLLFDELINPLVPGLLTFWACLRLLLSALL